LAPTRPKLSADQLVEAAAVREILASPDELEGPRSENEEQVRQIAISIVVDLEGARLLGE